MQTSHNLGHLKEQSSEFSPGGEDGSGTKQRFYLLDCFS